VKNIACVGQNINKLTNESPHMTHTKLLKFAGGPIWAFWSFRSFRVILSESPSKALSFCGSYSTPYMFGTTTVVYLPLNGIWFADHNGDRPRSSSYNTIGCGGKLLCLLNA